MHFLKTSPEDSDAGALVMSKECNHQLGSGRHLTSVVAWAWLKEPWIRKDLGSF
jgi:hypothetical protein